jgi:predicted metal-binding membrane protein
MGLLFVGGVMNLAWVAIITLFILLERLFPEGEWIARIGGGAMIAAGTYLVSS